MISKKVLFSSLSVEMQEAIKLLRKKRSLAIKGIGFYDIFDCPIASTYKIDAYYSWADLSLHGKKELERKGWNGKIYDAFILWYIGRNTKERRDRGKALRYLLR